MYFQQQQAERGKRCCMPHDAGRMSPFSVGIAHLGCLGFRSLLTELLHSLHVVLPSDRGNPYSIFWYYEKYGSHRRSSGEPVLDGAQMVRQGQIHDFLHAARPALQSRSGRHAITSQITKDVDRVATVRAETSNTQALSAAILYTCWGSSAAGPRSGEGGAIAPAPREPCTAPAAPASDSISTILT